MVQLFRSFQWSSFLVVLVLAAILRAYGWVEYALPEQDFAWGPWFSALPSPEWLPPELGWVIGTLSVSGLGFFGAYSLQQYRLGSVGAIPAYVGVLLASISVLWLGSSPVLVACLLLAVAAHRLFSGYRYQGAALPVFDCGLLLGAAWLLVPAFAWFVVWAALSIGQLRKFRFTDLLKLLLGSIALPLISAMAVYVWGDLTAFRQNLTQGIFGGPVWISFRESSAALLLSAAVVALLTFLALALFARLTTRRPIQEQRASRMFYTMLGVGWLAILVGGPLKTWSVGLVLYPLCILLGMALSEASRRTGNTLGLAALLLVLALQIATTLL